MNNNVNVPFIKKEPTLSASNKVNEVSTTNSTTSATKPNRLPSFRLPRDLTLGTSLNNNVTPAPTRNTNNITNNKNNDDNSSAAAAKKVFKPNLNVSRNKNVDVKTSRDTTHFGRGRGRDRNSTRGGGKGGSRNSNLIQTTGLFSHGGADVIKRNHSGYSDYRGSSSSSANDGINFLQKPTIKKENMKIDPDDEQEHYNRIIGEHNIGVDEDEDCYIDRLSLNANFTPITLTEIKKEKIDDATQKQLNGPTEYLHYPSSLKEFFDRSEPQLFLLQLPDTLPGHGSEKPINDGREGERPASPKPEDHFCTVKNLDEGLLGKIVRYKSGKTKFVLGNIKFDIDLAMDPGLLQEVVSVNTNREERSARMFSLGQIQAKLSVIPDWEDMLNKKVT